MLVDVGGKEVRQEYTFAEVLQQSMCLDHATQAWCSKCEKYQPHVCILNNGTKLSLLQGLGLLKAESMDSHRLVGHGFKSCSSLKCSPSYISD